MVDTVDKATRRRIMQSIKGRNTKPERALYRAMKKIGLTPKRWDKTLPGKPDFLFRQQPQLFGPGGAALAVFVDGCFFHGCPRHGSIPKSNVKFWQKKIHDNRARDIRVDTMLWDMNICTIRIWECDIKEDPSGCAMMVARMLYLD